MSEDFCLNEDIFNGFISPYLNTGTASCPTLLSRPGCALAGEPRGERLLFEPNIETLGLRGRLVWFGRGCAAPGLKQGQKQDGYHTWESDCERKGERQGDGNSAITVHGIKQAETGLVTYHQH